MKKNKIIDKYTPVSLVMNKFENEPEDFIFEFCYDFVIKLIDHFITIIYKKKYQNTTLLSLLQLKIII